MAAPFQSLRRVAPITCALVAVAICIASPSATTGDTIRVWKVGSPHRGETPDAAVPSQLERRATRLGFRITVEAFPARGFAATFFDAVSRGTAPDVLAFDNFGVMDGMTTALGTFEGVGTDPRLRKHFVRVTDAFDDLLGVERGWTYLFALSANHDAARTLALEAGACPGDTLRPGADDELLRVVPTLAAAYLQGDAITLQTYSDLERLPVMPSNRDPLDVKAVRSCGMWGNDKLAFASVKATYTAETAIGQTSVLLVLRKSSSTWRLLVAARDPISNGGFVQQVPGMTARLTKDGPTRALAPAALLAPSTGYFPRPSRGERFGTFAWRSSSSDDVVAEIAEFAYKDDARLFLTRPVRPGSRSQISAGQLWTTRSEWNWRIWSISSAGDVTFSEVRIFPN
jgi:hypothetical protein